jgi:hypothetical protein
VGKTWRVRDQGEKELESNQGEENGASDLARLLSSKGVSAN